MKKIMFAAMALTMGLAFTSCMGGEEMDVQKVEVAQQFVTADFQLNLRVANNADSRSIKEGDAEDSGIHENFVEPEFTVNNAHLYFCNGDDIVVEKDLVMDKLGNYTYKKEVKYEKFPVGTFDVYVVANSPKLPNVTKVSELLEAVGDASYAQAKMTAVPQGGFIMTNRGEEKGSITIAANQKATLNMTVERTVAKIRLNVAGNGNGKNAFYLLNEDGNRYATVFVGAHQYVNLNKDFYLFRHVAEIADAAEVPAKANVTFAYGAIPATNGYAIDPHFFEKTVAGASTVPSFLAYGYNTTFTADQDSIYCLPNTLFRPAQKHAYTTGIKLQAEIAPNKVLDKDGNAVENCPVAYYFNYCFYNSLEAAQTQGRLGVSCTEKNMEMYGVRKFYATENPNFYATSYTYWIRHHDPKPNPAYMNVMEFGIVRNNIYDLNVTGILGPGTPVIDPEDPDQPDPDDPNTDDEVLYELEVQLNVKPWIVRQQDIIFGF